MTESFIERRIAPRIPARISAFIALDDRRTLIDCTILDINAYGARVEIAAIDPPDLPEVFYLVDMPSGAAWQARKQWRQPPLVGTRFLQTWDLATPDSPQWLGELRSAKRTEEAKGRGIRLVWSTPE